jgi:hypothetical protein
MPTDQELVAELMTQEREKHSVSLPSRTKHKRLHKTRGEVFLDNVLLSELTKIEIVPILGKGYAITLRFIVSNSFAFPAFQDGARTILKYMHPNLPQPFLFKVEYVDLSIEDNCTQTELSVLLRGQKQETEKLIITNPQPQIVLA